MSGNKGTYWERELKKKLSEKGFYVVRASGSGVDGLSPDLVVLHTTKKFALECKARNDGVWIEAPKIKVMQEWQATTGLPVYVAWKCGREQWRFFPLNFLKEADKGFSLNKKDLPAGMALEELLA